jgi:hypothetical protein
MVCLALKTSPNSISCLLRTHSTWRLDLDGGQNSAVLPPSTFLLFHLAFPTELLQDHLGMAALMRVCVVETHRYLAEA